MGDEGFKTSDFLTAAFMIARKQKIQNFEKDGKRTIFIFEDEAACQVLKSDLIMGNDDVSAREFFGATKRLKTIIYDTP